MTTKNKIYKLLTGAYQYNRCAKTLSDKNKYKTKYNNVIECIEIIEQTKTKSFNYQITYDAKDKMYNIWFYTKREEFEHKGFSFHIPKEEAIRLGRYIKKMKIYRYMYKNKEVKIDSYEVKEPIVKLNASGRYVALELGEGKPLVYTKDLDKLNSFYIMWSFNGRLKNKFIDAVIDKKNEMANKHFEEVKRIEEDIDALEKEKC